MSIMHGGLVVDKNTGDEGGVWLSQVPQVGDVVTLESPVGIVGGRSSMTGCPR